MIRSRDRRTRGGISDVRILHILDHSLPLHSGYAFRTQAILRQQRSLGWQTVHLTSPKHYLDSPPRETVDGFEFNRMPPLSGLRARLPVVREIELMRVLARRLHGLVREVRPDILHAHSPVLNAIPALRVGARSALPVVYEVRAFWEDAAVSHGTTTPGSGRYRMSRMIETHAVTRADAVTTICEGMRGDLISRGLNPSKVTVIPNAVDLDEFHGPGERDPDLAAALGLEGKTVLGYFGSYYAYEGLALLLRAVAQLAAQRPDIRLLLAGGGLEEENLKRQADKIGISGAVIFAGRIPHNEVARYYDMADIMVYPRLSIRLTELVTPLKPLEAMAQGKIVVASDVGGHRELIRRDETGYLFEAGNVNSLAETILGALDDRPAWPERTARARAFVETERTWANSVAHYHEVYSRLLATRPRPAPAERQEQPS
jgi:PEP-CTERM/exosortase A-associated glycosyltransferase